MEPKKEPTGLEDKHLFVTTLAGGGKSWEAHVASREALRTVAWENHLSLSISRNAGTGVDRARNIECAKFLVVTPKATHWLQLDNDIAFDPKWVIQMVHTNLPICGAAYPRKDIDYQRLQEAVQKGVKLEELPLYETSFIVNGFNGGGYKNDYGFFAEVDEIGTGFMMIRRDVIEDFIAAYGEDIAYITDYPPRDTVHHMVFSCMRDPKCELEMAKKALQAAAKKKDIEALKAAADRYAKAAEDVPRHTGRYLTEDYSFCRLAAAIGHKTYCFLEANVDHIGTHVYKGAIKKTINMEAIEEVANAAK